MAKVLKDYEIEVLEYIYRHKAESDIGEFAITELPNQKSFNTLIREGLIYYDNSSASIPRVRTTAKGLDWAKKNLSTVSEATILDGAITLKVRKDIYDHIAQYLESDDYFHAVEESYKFVRERLRKLTGSEKATEAFGYDANNAVDYVKLFGHEPKDDIEKDFFKGIRFLHLSVQFLRNEKSHSLATTLDKNLALHYISIASLAYDLISREDDDSTSRSQS